MSAFRFYPEEQRWWSFNDYGAVLGVMRRLQPARVLEFGPGSSTLALVEGGASSIDTLEDNPKWACVYRARLQSRFPRVIALYEYTWSDPLRIRFGKRERWDLALIDGPHGTEKRPAVIAWCLTRCQAVLVPTEDGHDEGSLRPAIEQLAAKHRRHVEYLETGPLSGGFALVTRC